MDVRIVCITLMYIKYYNVTYYSIYVCLLYNCMHIIIYDYI